VDVADSAPVKITKEEESALPTPPQSDMAADLTWDQHHHFRSQTMSVRHGDSVFVRG
jgi:hypothetical protein